MTPQDRKEFQAFLHRQSQLENAVAQLRTDFKEFSIQAEIESIEATISEPPPLPAIPQAPLSLATPPAFPTLRTVEEHVMPEQEAKPALAETESIPLPEVPSGSESVGEKQLGLEFQFGRWLARIGVVFALIFIISLSTLAYKNFHHLMGPWSKLTGLTLMSVGLLVTGLKIERKEKLLVYGRTLAGGGLACLYYTLYGATYVAQLQVIHSQVLGGLILLGWSAGVLYLAEKKKSELLSIFSIALAYFSSAITPVGDFTMAANLILSLTAVIFLVRNAWTGLSYLCLIGTYVGLLRQFVFFDSTMYGFEPINEVAFWPSAIYLAGAWVIYTAGVFLAATPSFSGGKRMAFLCLNNGALIGLLILTTSLSGFGHMGAILIIVGAVFITTSYLAKYRRLDADVIGAYFIQGLALATIGLVIAYSGVTRGLLLTVESVFLVSAGAFSRHILMRIGGGACALLGVSFLAGEIVDGNHYPWLLTFTGAIAMLANAWLARREFWNQPHEIAAKTWVVSSSLYSFLALGLFAIGVFAHADSRWMGPDLAIAALFLTVSIYLLPLFELPFLAQGLLMLAQVISFVPPLGAAPASQGMSLGSYAQPLWSEWIVGAVTMVLVAWWPRQKLIRTEVWLTPMMLVYALAMVLLGFNSTHPYMDAQNWMMTASLLSLAFLAYGAWARTWPFMALGQIYLALSAWAFLAPSNGLSAVPWTWQAAEYPFDVTNAFPWAWWAAAVPVTTVFLTGWFISSWLPRFLKISDIGVDELRIGGAIYKAIALGLAIRWTFGVVPEAETTLAFFLIATSLLVWNIKWPGAFGVRSALVVDLVGIGSYLSVGNNFSWLDTFALLLFLAQPALLRYGGRTLITELESWAVILLSAGTAWLFVSHSINAGDSHNLTLGWAIFALVVTIIGFAANERRQRWCGLIILVASIIRVAVYDFWLFSDLYKVLTFFALTVICLGLSFLYYKFGDRLKELL